MSEKHTPGPWTKYGTEVAGGVGTREAFVVCALTVGHISPATPFSYINPEHRQYDETVEANARLIAAAPELLAALKAIMWRAEIHAARIQDSELYERALTEIRAARAAIAKAEGRS